MNARPSKSYGMDEQLEEGRLGEEVVLPWLEAQYGVVTDVRAEPSFQRIDIDFLGDGLGLEVKTDKKAHMTGNLFLEFEALEKSAATLWYIYLPQRDWVFRFARADLLAYALAQPPSRIREVWSEQGGRRWKIRGALAPMSELLLKLQGALHTQITKEVESHGAD